jgi:hypothetical protein
MTPPFFFKHSRNNLIKNDPPHPALCMIFWFWTTHASRSRYSIFSKKSIFKLFQKKSQILIFFQHSAQKIEKYIKLHVLGDFGYIWIGISEDIQKIDFSSSCTENLIPWKFDLILN